EQATALYEGERARGEGRRDDQRQAERENDGSELSGRQDPTVGGAREPPSARLENAANDRFADGERGQEANGLRERPGDGDVSPFAGAPELPWRGFLGLLGRHGSRGLECSLIGRGASRVADFCIESEACPEQVVVRAAGRYLAPGERGQVGAHDVVPARQIDAESAREHARAVGEQWLLLAGEVVRRRRPGVVRSVRGERREHAAERVELPAQSESIR